MYTVWIFSLFCSAILVNGQRWNGQYHVNANVPVMAPPPPPKPPVQPPAQTPAPPAVVSGPTCYTCNYLPNGASGTSICGLEQATDFERVDKWPCKSGTCFIRRDKSGLIYRGCANPENLPFGVSSPQQCLTQTYTGAVWWFCQGTMCNNGTIGGTENRCSAAVAAQVAMMAQNPPSAVPSPQKPQPRPPAKTPAPVPMPVKPFYPAVQPAPVPMPVEPSFYPYPAVQPVPVWVQQPPEPIEVVHMPEPMRVLGDQTYEMQRPMMMSPGPVVDQEDIVDPDDLPNPCDGKCLDNPSGLFPDPRAATFFIQCGSGYGCTCCKPFYLSCPLRTQFDVLNRVCTVQPGIIPYSSGNTNH